MTATITVLPSGHEFTVEEGETILEAALRAGLSLDYHCNNGTCGKCIARVSAGEAPELLPHDYLVKAEDQRSGAILLCRALPRSDLVIEAAEARNPQDIPSQRLETTVYKMDLPTEDVMVLQLRTPRSNTLRFLAGQYVTLHLGEQRPRSKSIASCPCNGMFLHFHIRRVPGDSFSDFVFRELKPRQKVMIEGPFGDFVLDDESRRPLIFVAFETGFAPIKSLIEHAVSLELPQPMRLYWIVQAKGDHYLLNLCRAWQDVLDDFEFKALVGGQLDIRGREALAELGLDWNHLSSAERGMAEAAACIVRDYPDLGASDVYVNGSRALLAPTRELLLSHGLPAERLFADEVRRF